MNWVNSYNRWRVLVAEPCVKKLPVEINELSHLTSFIQQLLQLLVNERISFNGDTTRWWKMKRRCFFAHRWWRLRMCRRCVCTPVFCEWGEPTYYRGADVWRSDDSRIPSILQIIKLCLREDLVKITLQIINLNY